MTLIECFTDSHVDNLAACLRLCPQTLVIVGDESRMLQPMERYRALLRQRGLQTRVTPCDIGGKGLADICSGLRRLLQEQEEAVIDLTGGDELVIMAVGAVLAQLDEGQQKKVRVQKWDPSRGCAVDCIDGGRPLPGKGASLTVEELIRLYGGVLHPDAYQPPRSSTRKELDALWSIVADEPKEWNRAISVLNEFESRADSKNQVFLPWEHLRSSISRFDEKEAEVLELLDKLQRKGVIHDESSRYALEYTYCSPLLRYCTLKAGNVLEVKTLLEARAVRDGDAPFFQDCLMSVSIDWDGIVHEPAHRIPETRNEIDVVLMHGAVPLFVSCKNGGIGEEELYKLHTVAHRFGGPHAKKMLIATDLAQKNASADRAFIQRARDMDIYLVSEAAQLSADEWTQCFKQAMR